MSLGATDIGQQISFRGFALLTNAFSSLEMDQLMQDLDASGLKRSKAGIRHILLNPAITALAHDYRLLGIARQTLGEGTVPFKATLFDKSQESNWLVVWHQDTALPIREKREVQGWGPWSVKENINYAHAPARALEQVLALRVHLDDSNVDNGPLRVLPATHAGSVFTDDQLAALAARISPVDCIVPKGGVVAMKPLVVHASSKCDSTARRRVIHLEYATSMQLEPDIKLALA